jgi:hypothetical protein
MLETKKTGGYMISFWPMRKLNKHYAGILYNELGVMGSAIHCGSDDYTSVSINDKDLKIAEICFNHVYFTNSEKQEKVLSIAEVVEIVTTHGRRPQSNSEYRVVDWWNIDPTEEKLPF